MSTKTTKFLSLVFTIITFYNSLFGQDQCNDVLIAAYNKLNITQTSSSASAAKSWFCSDKFLSDIKNNSLGGTVTVPIDGIPVEFGGNSSNQRSIQLREQFCQSASSSFTNDEALAIFSQVVERRTIEAWENCMKEKFRARASGINLFETVVGNEIFVTARFNIISDADRNTRPVIIGCYYSGVTQVAGQWMKGAEVTTSGILQQFRRKSENEPVSITLQTSLGLSQPLILKAKDYPLEVGEISVEWEEPYQGESSPQLVWQEIVTGDHSCYSNCKGEPTRTNYRITLDGTNWGNGFLKNLELKCLEGPCPWSAPMEKKLINSKVAFGSLDVWAGPMRWRLSGEWVFYETKWKSGAIQKKVLKRGDEISLYVPKNARNVKIFGKTLDGYFDYPINSIGSSQWLKYNGYSNSETYYVLKFKIPSMPDVSSKSPFARFGD